MSRLPQVVTCIAFARMSFFLIHTRNTIRTGIDARAAPDAFVHIDFHRAIIHFFDCPHWTYVFTSWDITMVASCGIMVHFDRGKGSNLISMDLSQNRANFQSIFILTCDLASLAARAHLLIVVETYLRHRRSPF